MCRLCEGKQHVSEICENCIIPEYMTEIYFSGLITSMIPKLPKSLKILCFRRMDNIVFSHPLPDLETLHFYYCDNIELPKLPESLKKLVILDYNNSEMSLFPDLPNLEVLHLTNFPKLKVLPVLYKLRTLDLENVGVSSIIFPDVKTLYATRCEHLTSIIVGEKSIVTVTRCYSFLFINHQAHFLYSMCPWFKPDEKKISKLIRAQRISKKIIRANRFSRWINSRDGKEFIYHPDNIGGKIEKKRKFNSLSSITNEL